MNEGNPNYWRDRVLENRQHMWITLICIVGFVGFVFVVGQCEMHRSDNWHESIRKCVAAGRNPSECRLSMSGNP